MSCWKEGSLDPENWDDIEIVAKQIIHDLTNYLSTISTSKTFIPLGRKEYLAFQQEIPQEEMAIKDCYSEVFEKIIKRSASMNLHPGFWGWAMGGGSPVGFLAKIIEAGLNLNMIGGMQISSLVEEQVLIWLKEMFGFADNASGILTSGCSEANLIAMTLARNSAGPDKIIDTGLVQNGQEIIIYMSEEGHFSLLKAATIIGLGHQNIKSIPVNDNFEIDTTVLRRQIADDRVKGKLPTAIIANLGTVNTGAIDDLEELLIIAKEENLWLHVDGAFGALALLTDEYRSLWRIIMQVDSLAFDLHKWLGIPYNCGCLLTNHAEIHTKSFRYDANYLKHDSHWTSDYTISLSRNFSSLSVWMVFKAYGINKLIECIEKNLQHAKYLGLKIEDNTELELLAPISMNIVCFRYKREGVRNVIMDKMNQAIIAKLTLEGSFLVSATKLRHGHAIRVCFLNYRTSFEQIEEFVYRILHIGRSYNIAEFRER